jgi:hypothetical protein
MTTEQAIQKLRDAFPGHKIYAASQTTSQFDFQVKPVTTYLLIRDELFTESKVSFEDIFTRIANTLSAQ